MKREKQKYLSCSFVILSYFLTNNAIINVQGYTNNNYNNKVFLIPINNSNSNERSASLLTTISDNGFQKKDKDIKQQQYLQRYFKRIMEPIRNNSNEDRKYIYSSTFASSTEPYYSPRIDDMNTQPNYIYPNLHSTPYFPIVITERYSQQNHLTQKKDSADSSKLKVSARSWNSEAFRPRIIPVEHATSSAFSSRSLRVLDDDDGNKSDEDFQPFATAAEVESRKLQPKKVSTRRKDAVPTKSKIEATTKKPSVQPSTQAPWKNVPEVSRDPKSRVMEEESRGKIKKKYRKYMLPLLLAYKLKFFTLIPLMMGGLVLLTGATGMAGFFFALFASVIGLRVGNPHS